MNIRNVRLAMAVTGTVLVGGMTLSFLARDLAWSGQWETRARPFGKKTASISAPWPENHGTMTPEGFLATDESVYATVRFPRRFDHVTITIETEPAIREASIGIETRPNTLQYLLAPIDVSSKPSTIASALINLSGVDQRLQKLNMIVRIPGAATAQPVLIRSVQLSFRRPPRTVSTFLGSIWNAIKML